MGGGEVQSAQEQHADQRKHPSWSSPSASRTSGSVHLAVFFFLFSAKSIFCIIYVYIFTYVALVVAFVLGPRASREQLHSEGEIEPYT